MMKVNFRTSFVCGALALTATLAAVAPAEAAVYRGRFDPTYGAPFDQNGLELAWSGELVVEVDDACVQKNKVVYLLDGCGGFQIKQAEVTLFNANDPTKEKETIVFAKPESPPSINGLSWSLTFDGNKDLIAATTTAYAAVKGSIDETKYDDVDNAYFSLQFLGDYAQLYWFRDEPTPFELLALTNPLGVCRENGETNVRPKWWNGYNDNVCGWSISNEERGSFIKFSRDSEVPEPATYALVPSALAIMGFVGMTSRRRRAAVAAAQQ